MKPRAIWLVVSEGQIIGIYPDDMNKANEVAGIVHSNGSDAMIHKYVPSESGKDRELSSLPAGGEGKEQR